MTVLISPTRYSRSSALIPTDLIEWRESADGVWTGTIDVDYAGTIALVDGKYRVTDWKGEEQSTTRSLRTAKESLEPRRRMADRDDAERRALRLQFITTGAAAVAFTLALITVINGVVLGS